jgi:nitrogen regulatory protein PII
MWWPMKSFKVLSGYEFVTAILPRQSASVVAHEVLSSGAAHVMTTSARGTLMQQHWYQSFLPAISPEQEMLHFIVPGAEVDRLMEEIVLVGKLQLYGAGSIFAIPCVELVCSDDYPLWNPGDYRFESVSFDIKFKRDLKALIHTTDRGTAEPIARAAIKAGAQGATITYVRGYGLRDRLGLLRITKRHEKELITVVVDEFDLDAVFQGMAQSGRVEQPGSGFIYQLPVSKGLTNLASVFQAKKHSVSIHQMVRAIDSLSGGTQWRANPLHVHDPRAREFATNSRGLSRDLTLLNVVSQRKDSETLLQLFLEQGVSGASISNWRFTDAQASQSQAGIRIIREFGCLSLVSSTSNVNRLMNVFRDAVTSMDLRSTCCFTHHVPMVKTFAPIR